MSEDLNMDIAEEFVKQTAGKAYDDLAHPGLEATGAILSFVPRTIRVWLGKWEKWIINGEESIRLTVEAVKEKATAIPEENLTEPEAYVAVPTIQQLSYCYDSKELRELYANLLVSSMNKETKFQVHPSFVDIIKQMTPDEAKLLKTLPTNSMVYHPLVDLEINLGPGKGRVALLRNYTNIAFGICECPININSYLENLDRLKIIHILNDIHLMDDSKYDPIVNSAFFIKHKNAKLSEGLSFNVKKKSFYVTDFGLSFIKTCVTSPLEEN